VLFDEKEHEDGDENVDDAECSRTEGVRGVFLVKLMLWIVWKTSRRSTLNN
jgi:hypothetical protein